MLCLLILGLFGLPLKSTDWQSKTLFSGAMNKLQLLIRPSGTHVDAHSKGLFSDETNCNQAADQTALLRSPPDIAVHAPSGMGTKRKTLAPSAPDRLTT